MKAFITLRPSAWAAPLAAFCLARLSSACFSMKDFSLLSKPFTSPYVSSTVMPVFSVLWSMLFIVCCTPATWTLVFNAALWPPAASSLISSLRLWFTSANLWVASVMPCILSTLFWVYSAFSLSPRNNPSQIVSVSLRSSLASPFTCAKVSSICAVEALLLEKNGIFLAEKVLTELPQDLHLIGGLGVRLDRKSVV